MPEMQTAATIQGRAPSPYATADELKSAHADLLRRRRFSDDAPEFVEEVRAFIARVQATGVLLDTDAERSNAQTLLNYWSNALCHAGAAMPDAILAEYDDTQAPELDEAQCPYASLNLEQPEDTVLFLGWQRLIKDCIEKLQQTGIAVVVGAGGSGRSSLVRGGLVPTLKEEGDFGSAHWRYHVMPSPGADPLAQLAKLMPPPEGASADWHKQQVEAFRKEAGHLARLLNADSQTPAVLVIDQFETLFQTGDDQDRQAFFDNLQAIVKGPQTRHMLVLVMRSDCLNQAAQLDGMHTVLQQSQVFVAFTTRELRQAIEEPAKHVGLRFDDGVVDRLLRDIQGDPSAMTLLQFTLLNFWDHRERNRITEEMYHRLGAGRLALERVAETLYKGLSASEQETLKQILMRLVRPATGQEVNTSAVRRAQLYQAGQPRAHVDRVFNQLVGARLVRVSAAENPEDALVSVWHEALVSHWPRLVEWLYDERDNRRRRLRLTAAAEQWRDKGRDEGALWGGTLLEDALKCADLSPLEQEFIGASKELRTRQEQSERRRRRNRFIALGTIAGLVIIGLVSALIFTVHSLGQAKKLSDEQEKLVAEQKKVVAAQEKVVAEQKKGKQELEEKLAEMIIDRGNGLVKANDVAGAQLWFTEALKLDTHNGLPDKIHRIRLGAGLRQLPRLSQLWPHETVLTSAAFSEPDGKHVITTSQDGRATIWDTATGAFTPLTKSEMWMNWAAFSPDARYVLTGSGNPRGNAGETILWDVRTRTELWKHLHSGAVLFVAFTPDGRSFLAAGETDGGNKGEVRVWNTETRAVMAEMPHKLGKVNQAAFSPDQGRYVVTASGQAGGETGEAQIWDLVENRKLLAQKSSGAVSHAEFSPDGQKVVLACEEKAGEAGQARIVNLPSARPPGVYIPPPPALIHDKGVMWAAFSPDGSKIVTASHDGTARIWDVETGAAVWTLKHGSSVYCATFSPDGRYVVTGSRDRSARIYEVITGELAMPLLSDIGTVGSVCFSPDGQRVLTTCNRTARIWQLTTVNSAPRTLNTAWVQHLMCSDGGKLVLTVGGKSSGAMEEARLWTAETGESVVKEPFTHEGAMTCAALSPDAQWVATAGAGRNGNSPEVWIRKVATPREKTVLRTNGVVSYLLFSADGKRLLTAAAEPGLKTGMQRLRLWDTATGEALPDKLGESEKVTCAAFSPDGRWLATGTGKLTGDTSKAQAWNVETLERISPPEQLTHKEFDGGMIHVAFSPNSEFLVTASADDTAKVWRIQDREKKVDHVWTFPHTADVTFAVFSSNSQLLATVGKDQTATVWDVKTGLKKSRFKHDDTTPSHAAFSATGDLLVTANQDGSARLWDVRNGSRDPVSILRHHGPMQFAFFDPATDSKLVTINYLTRSMQQRTARRPAAAPPKGLPPRPVQGPARIRQVQTRVWNIAAEQRTSDDLQRLSELLSARRYDEVAISLVSAALTKDAEKTLSELWQDQKKSYGANFPVKADDPLRDANESEATGQRFAALWHLRRVHEPSADLLMRRANFASALWTESTKNERDLVVYLRSAIADLQRAAKIDPKNGKEISGHLSKAFEMLGDAQRAKSLPEAVTAYQNAVNQQPGDAGNWDKLARAFELSWQWHEAENAREEAVRLKPSDHEAKLNALKRKDVAFWQELVREYAGLGMKKNAIDTYQEALKLEPKNPFLWKNLAATYEASGRSKEAIDAYTKAIDLDRKNVHLWQSLAHSHEMSRNWEKAIDAYTEAIKVDSKQRVLLENRALACEKLGQWDKAVGDYTEAIKLPNPDAWLFNQRAHTFAVLGKYNQAADDLAKAQNDYYASQRLALVRLAAGDKVEYRKACAAMLKRVAAQPLNPQIANSAAWACVLGPNAVDDPKEPIRLSEKAVAGLRNNNNLNTLGAAYYRAGDYQNAIAKLQEGMKLGAYSSVAPSPGVPVPYVTIADWLFLAMAHHGAGNNKEAQRWFGKAQQAIDTINQSRKTTASSPLTTWERIELDLFHGEAEALLKESKN